MKFVLGILFVAAVATAATKPQYTFDPFSLKHSYYDPANCTRVGDTLSCKKATLTFGAMTYGTSEQIKAQGTTLHGSATSTAKQAGDVVVTFIPRKCKLAPLKANIKNGVPKFVQRDEWVCKDVSFRWIQ